MPSRRRVFLESDRERFVTVLGRMRAEAIDVLRRAPCNGVDYQTASTLKARIDDAVEALTGDRERFWSKPHATPRC